MGVPPAGAPASSSAGLSENAAGALCYALTVITGIIFLVLEPYNRNPRVRFHAFQAIFLFVAWLVILMARILLATMLGFAGLWILWMLIGIVLGLGFFILWLYMIIATVQGKLVVLPIIGPLAQKQAQA
jgi:uncharacterized membrane protein